MIGARDLDGDELLEIVLSEGWEYTLLQRLVIVDDNTNIWNESRVIGARSTKSGDPCR